MHINFFHSSKFQQFSDFKWVLFSQFLLLNRLALFILDRGLLKISINYSSILTIPFPKIFFKIFRTIVEMAVSFPEPSLLLDPAKIRSVVAVGEHGKTDRELYCPRAVAIDPDSNLIYVVGGEYNSAFVSIFSETGEFLNFFTHKHIISLWGIAIFKENIYVTDASLHTVFHLKIGANIRLVARLGGRGTRNGQFEEPRQLVVSTCGDVFVTDSLNHRIQILDCNLQYQRQMCYTTP